MKHITISPADLPYTLVGYGVDTLVVNVRYADPAGVPCKDTDALLPDYLITILEAWKAAAQLQGKPISLPVRFEDANLQMYHHGAGKGQWRWLITCPAFNLMISRGKLNGVVAQVRFSSRFLWSHEWPDDHTQDIWPAILAVKEVLLGLLQPHSGRLHLQVSELHLCADIAGWDISASDWRHGFISRARTQIDQPETGEVAGGPGKMVYVNRKLATLTFGTHGSPLSCCIYNKTLELKTSGKTWLEFIWRAHGWDSSAPVWRVEYRWKREALHDAKLDGEFHGIEEVADLDPLMLSRLWTYCAGHIQAGPDGFPDGWLRFAEPCGKETNTSRWPVHPAWVVIQSAFAVSTEQAVNVHTGEVLDVPISDLATLIRQRHYQVNVKRLAQQIGGCASTLAAWLGGLPGSSQVDDLPSVLRWLVNHLPAIALPELVDAVSLVQLKSEYATQFAEIVAEKRAVYGVPAHTKSEVQHDA
jgi:hypothetical protein